MIDQLSQSDVTIEILQLDLTDEQQLRANLSHAIASTDPPLKGVFHLAGETDDNLLPNQIWQSFAKVLSAKVSGTWNLHQITQNVELDHFVMFSSVASLLGSTGQANYAAANSFLDAIAHLRRQQGLPALSLNWAAWSGAGLAANLEVEQRLSRAGIPLLDPATSFEMLRLLIGSAESAQIGILPGRIANWQKVGIQSLFLSGLSHSPNLHSPNLHSPNPQLSNATKSTIQVALERNDIAVLSDHLRAQLAIVLGKEAALINADNADFTDLGLDSLTAVEFRNRLQTSLACVLPVTLVYEYPTLSELRDYIVDLLTLSQSVPATSNTEEDYIEHPTENSSQHNLEDLSEEEAQTLLLQELIKLDQS